MNGVAVNMQEDYNNARDSKLTIKIDFTVKIISDTHNSYWMASK